MFIDFPMDIYKNPQQIVPPKLQTIGSEASDISTFVDTLYDHLIHNSSFSKINLLHQQLKNIQGPICIANEIDQ